jgi:simple sugar transport system permease protein
VNDTALVLTVAAAVAAAVPIALAGLGELLAERSGVLNLGLEGMMLIGAVVAFLVGDGTGNLWLALVLGMVAAAGLALVHAFLCVTLRANQIVSGLALVIFGTGLSTFVGKPIEGTPLATDLRALRLGALADVPVLGPVLFRQDPIVYATVALAAGAGGAYLILAQVPSWSQDGTTSGLGWIALALVVFASWNPWRVLFGALLFGLARRANFFLQDAGVDVAAELLSMLPYLLTIIVLVVWGSRDLRRRVGAPAALGLAFVRDER